MEESKKMIEAPAKGDTVTAKLEYQKKGDEDNVEMKGNI